MKKLFFIFILTFPVLFISCNSNTRDVEAIFRMAEKQVEQDPIEALSLLYAVNPATLDQEKYARYILLVTRAKDKNYEDIASDTLIFQARNYFKARKDVCNWAFAEFYAGRVYQSQEKFEDAMHTYLEAESLSIKANELALTGLIQFFIGELNYQHHLYSEAIAKFKDSATNFNQAKKGDSEIAAYSYLANCFFIEAQSDSAFQYYDRALSLAKQRNDSTEQQAILQNMGVTYFHLNQPTQAKEMFRQAMNLSVNQTYQAKLYFNIAKLHAGENQLDSASFYVQQALQIMEKEKDLPLYSNVYQLLSDIEMEKKNYAKGLEYQKESAACLKAIVDEQANVNLNEIQKKYDLERIQNENNQLIIEKQRNIIVAILIVMLLVGGFIVMYLKRKRDNEILLTAHQKIYQLENMLTIQSDNLDKNKEKVKKMFIKHLNVAKNLALAKPLLGNEVKGSVVLEIVQKHLYGSKKSIDWKSMLTTFDDVYDGYVAKLKNRFPNLKEIEVLICCLNKAHFTDGEISLFINLDTPNAVQKRKSRIRKMLTMPKQDNFVEQLDALINHANKKS